MLSPWGRVVAISALLVAGGALALVVGAIASTRPHVGIYPVRGEIASLAFDLADGDIEIVGGGNRDEVSVRRTASYAFGHAPTLEPTVKDGAYRVRARCPTSLVGGCSLAYRVVVPDNVELNIRTTSGAVSLRGYRGTARVTTTAGAVSISGYCGNLLEAHTGAGDISVAANCAPPRMTLRSGSGGIHAVMPPGRYDLDAESTSGATGVHGVQARDDAPYVVQALSASGEVLVEGRS